MQVKAGLADNAQGSEEGCRTELSPIQRTENVVLELQNVMSGFQVLACDCMVKLTKRRGVSTRKMVLLQSFSHVKPNG